MVKILVVWEGGPSQYCVGKCNNVYLGNWGLDKKDK